MLRLLSNFTDYLQLPATLCSAAAISDGRLASSTYRLFPACRSDPAARRLQDLMGVGPTTADAVVATAGNAKEFRNGRQFAAWLRIVPRQFSTGGKARLGGITKRGDAYLRTLLVLGAKSVLKSALKVDPDKASRLQLWARELNARVGYHKTLVAIAGYCART